MRIEVIDLAGKVMNVLYEGPHDGHTKVHWDAEAHMVAPGLYLCRVSSYGKAISEKIMVQ